MNLSSFMHPSVTLLTTEDVSHRWQCHRATVDRYRKSGRLRSVHVGGGGRLVRFRLEDVEAFERANQAGADAE